MSSHGHSQNEVRSHRRIGEALDLFNIPEHSPGIASWHPRGLIVYRELERLVRELGEARGYEEVRCPSLWDWSVWERSGHARKFSDKMFSLEGDGRSAWACWIQKRSPDSSSRYHARPSPPGSRPS